MNHQVSSHYDERASFYKRNFRAAAYRSESSFHQRRRVVLQWLSSVRRQRILDAGCGPGLLSEPLARENFLVGLDLSEKMLHLARKGLRPVRGEGEKLPFRNDSFDIVLAIEVLQHVGRPEIFLKEFGRILRPDGQLILSSLNPDSWAQGFLRRLGLSPRWYVYHSLQEVDTLLNGEEWVCLAKRFLGYPLPWSWSVTEAFGPFSFFASSWMARFQKRSQQKGPSG